MFVSSAVVGDMRTGAVGPAPEEWEGGQLMRGLWLLSRKGLLTEHSFSVSKLLFSKVVSV